MDEGGAFVYRTGVLQRLKGWGKDPLLAVISLVELVGPSRLSHWEDGQPVAKPCENALVQAVAVSQDQTYNTMDMIPALLTDEVIAEYGIKVGQEIIRANGGRCKFQAVTSSYRSLEGKRTTFTLLNETQHWVTGNDGHKLYETIDGNATKVKGRYLAITNAYLPGEASVAERMRGNYEKLIATYGHSGRFMYDSLEANPLTPLTPDAARHVLPIIRGDSVWLDIDEIADSIINSGMQASRSRRMWYNQIIAEEDALYGPEQLKAIEDRDLVLRRGDKITLGFDGSKSRDDTALVAIRVTDGATFVLGHWFRPDNDSGREWTVPRPEVDGAVRDAFREYTVVGFYADVRLWESYISDWTEDYGEQLQAKATLRDPIAWDMRAGGKRGVFAHERLMAAIFDQKIKYDGDLWLQRHALNAKRKTNNQYGVYFDKESRESPRKVDLYAAWMLAHEAYNDYRTRSNRVEEPTTGRMWTF